MGINGKIIIKVEMRHPKVHMGLRLIFLKDIMSYSRLFTIEGSIDPVRLAFDDIPEVCGRY
jgi:hypothetical protein